MQLRRKARECALQMMFQWEVGQQDPAGLAASFWKHTRADWRVREFATRLFEGTVATVAEIDDLLARHAQNWRTDRMAAVDRNILRVAVYELKSHDTPANVVLEEAIELAKKFSSEGASAFINGVLAAAAKELAGN